MSATFDPMAILKHLPPRILSKIRAPRLEGDCWEWIAAKNRQGYGKFKFEKADRQAHRVMYQLVFGAPARHNVIDHLCRNRACVNPTHLEEVSFQENMARGAHAIATHCKHGHEYTAENTFMRPKGAGCERECRACWRRRTAIYKEKRRSQ